VISPDATSEKSLALVMEAAAGGGAPAKPAASTPLARLLRNRRLADAGVAEKRPACCAHPAEHVSKVAALAARIARRDEVLDVLIRSPRLLGHRGWRRKVFSLDIAQQPKLVERRADGAAIFAFRSCRRAVSRRALINAALRRPRP
jgi:hypothetical protein